MSTDTRMAAVVAAALAARVPAECFAFITVRDAVERIEHLGGYDVVFYMGPSPGVEGATHRVALYPVGTARVDKWHARTLDGRGVWREFGPRRRRA